MPASTTIVSPSDAASIIFCRPVFGSPSITYAPGAHCGNTYTAPLAKLTPISVV